MTARRDLDMGRGLRLTGRYVNRLINARRARIGLETRSRAMKE
jgi:hypothetical protein